MSRRNEPGPTPRVTVLLCARDAEATLPEALASLRAQTLRDYELVVYDDGSRDATGQIVAEAARADPRVRLVSRPAEGLTVWLREGVERAHAPLLARMDADDVAHPERLARQVRYLETHPDVVAAASDVLLVDPARRPIARLQPPLAHAGIDRELLRGNGGALPHPAVLMRRDAVLSAGGYDIRYTSAQDVDLFLRLAERGRLANLPEVLLEYRQHAQAVSVARAGEQQRNVARAIAAAHARRGLPAPAVAEGRPPDRLEPADTFARWARAAIGGGHPATARRYAWAVLSARPWAIGSWRLALRAALGVRLRRPGRTAPQASADPERAPA